MQRAEQKSTLFSGKYEIFPDYFGLQSVPSTALVTSVSPDEHKKESKGLPSSTAVAVSLMTTPTSARVTQSAGPSLQLPPAAQPSYTRYQIARMVQYRLEDLVKADDDLASHENSIYTSSQINIGELKDWVTSILYFTNFSAKAFKAALIYIERISPEGLQAKELKRYFFTAMYYAVNKFDSKPEIKSALNSQAQAFQDRYERYYLSHDTLIKTHEDFYSRLLGMQGVEIDDGAFSKLESEFAATFKEFEQREADEKELAVFYGLYPIENGEAEQTHPQVDAKLLSASMVKKLSSDSKLQRTFQQYVGHYPRLDIYYHIVDDAKQNMKGVVVSNGAKDKANTAWDEKFCRYYLDSAMLINTIILLERANASFNSITFLAALFLADNFWMDHPSWLMAFFRGYDNEANNKLRKYYEANKTEKRLSAEILKALFPDDYKKYNAFLTEAIRLFRSLNHVTGISLGEYQHFIERCSNVTDPNNFVWNDSKTVIPPASNKTLDSTRFLVTHCEQYVGIKSLDKALCANLLSVIQTNNLSQRTILAAIIYLERYQENAKVKITPENFEQLTIIALWIAAYHHDENFPQLAEAPDDNLQMDAKAYDSYKNKFAKSVGMNSAVLDAKEEEFRENIRQPKKIVQVIRWGKDWCNSANGKLAKREWAEAEKVRPKYDANIFIYEKTFEDYRKRFSRMMRKVSVISNSVFNGNGLAVTTTSVATNPMQNAGNEMVAATTATTVRMGIKPQSQ